MKLLSFQLKAGIIANMLFFASMLFSGSANAQTLSCSSNLLPNPGFENNLVEWNNLGGGTIVTNANSGSKALSVCGTASALDYRVVDAVPVTPGLTYAISAWAKTTSGSTTDVITYKFLTATWQPIVTFTIPITSTNYQQYTAQALAPANAAHIEVGVKHLPASGCLTVDDFCVSAGGNPPCTINASVSTPICDNAGTSGNPDDDTFSFSVTVNNISGSWVAFIPNADIYGTNTTIAGTNGVPKVLTYPIASVNNFLGGVVNFNVVDTQNSSCTAPVSVNAPATCSSGGSGLTDLSLALQQLTTTATQWSSYSVKATISNAGPQAATGVKVKWQKPTGVVYVGSNSHTASQGAFSPYGDEVWTVGSIPVNGSATLTVNYFLLNPTASPAYAQVTAHNETDVDSQPNNGTPPTPVQDDEASTSGSSNNCTNNLGAGEILCTEKSGSYLLAYLINNQVLTKYTLNSQGAVVSTENMGLLVQDSVLVQGNQVKKKLANGTIAYTKTIPQSVLNSLPVVQAATELTNGNFVLAGYRKLDNTNPISASKNNLVLVYTNANLVPIQVNSRTVSTIGNPYHNFGDQVLFLRPAPNAAFDIFFTSTIETLIIFRNVQLSRYSFADPQSFDQASSLVTNLVSQGTMSPVKLTQTPCGSYRFSGPTGSLGNKGSFFGQVVAYYDTHDLSLISAQVDGAGNADLYGSYDRWTFVSSPPDSLTGSFQYRPGVDPLPNMQFIIPNAGQPSYGVNVPYFNYDHAVVVQPNDVFLFGSNNGQVFVEVPTDCHPVVLLQPDLTGDGLSLPPNQIFVPGAVVNFNFTLINIGNFGTHQATNISMMYYLSSDAVLSANDLLVGDSNNAALGTGASAIVNGVINLPANIPSGSYYILVKIDPNNVHPESNENNNLVVSAQTFTVSGVVTPDCNAITITPGSGTLSIANAAAPHLLIKVFRPNWTIAFQCLDAACSQPVNLTGLGTGTHHIQILLFNANWQTICSRNETVTVTNLDNSGGMNSESDPGSTMLSNKLQLETLYPNPAEQEVILQMVAAEDDIIHLQLYDARGALKGNFEIALQAGVNSVPLDIANLPTGMYHVLFQTGQRHEPVRFIKQRL